MSAYDQKDFELNAGKYPLFRTATIAKSIITHNGEDDLPEGKIVSIEYRGTFRNQLYKRMEPVFNINGGNHCLYANCLKNFVL